MNSPIERLQKTAAPELNFLLTEPPRLGDGEYDFGWYCREHAFCTAVLGALLGISCQIVCGDFLIRTIDGFRLGSVGAAHDHSWCRTDTTPVLDLSLHFRQFGPGPQIAEPIIRLGRNGIFDVRILPVTTEPFMEFGNDAFIGYIPRKILHETAVDWVHSPLPFLRTGESAAISTRIALHVFRVLSGERDSLVGRMTQFDALAYLRRSYESAEADLQELIENAA